ncbi:DUF58 domain-containing protein [Haloferula sp. A504]|uniref:DUF58 domain-containing protein n=1 Tax=Haloferula sp. A504 TaxID=3373601 RepID=UPI0031C33EE3|nr:DUF58 domain-containing protein [Verrucomicrobiaceae bacterium E54]
MRYRLANAHDRLNQRQFTIAVRRLATSLGYGSDRSRFLGSGMDYVQSRPYVPGDPVKQIDWRVSGRTGKPHVKEYEATKMTPVYLLVDTSASMCVSSMPVSKYAWAVQIATALALVALDRMSPVGVLACGERDLHIKPTLSSGLVMQWSYHLRHFDFHERTSLGVALRELTASLKSRCLILALSDLHDPEAVAALKLAAQEHDVAALQLQDPAERGVRGGGFFRAREAETGEAFVAHGSHTWFDDHDRMAHELHRAAVDHVLLKTETSFVPKLVHFLARRNRLGRGAR